MRVNEVVTESVYDWWANRQQQKTAQASMQPGYVGPETSAFHQQMDPILKRQQQQAVAQKAAAQASAQVTTTDKSKPVQGAILLVKGPGGMEYFKSHKGIWFEKPDSRDRYSASGALQIKDPVKSATLDKLLPQAQTIYVKPESQSDNINFVPDPTARAAKLSAKRQKTKVKQ
jgi:hypothetical protein